MSNSHPKENVSVARPLIGIGVIVIKDNQILLGKRKGSHGAGEWALPGGHLEFGETLEQCAQRELSEETGLTTQAVAISHWVEDFIEGNKHYITFFGEVREFQGEPQCLEPHKCEGWQWFERHKLPSPLFKPILSLLNKVNLT